MQHLQYIQIYAMAKSLHSECNFVISWIRSVSAGVEQKPALTSRLSCVRAGWPRWSVWVDGRPPPAIVSYPHTGHTTPHRRCPHPQRPGRQAVCPSLSETPAPEEGTLTDMENEIVIWWKRETSLTTREGVGTNGYLCIYYIKSPPSINTSITGWIWCLYMGIERVQFYKAYMSMIGNNRESEEARGRAAGFTRKRA